MPVSVPTQAELDAAIAALAVRLGSTEAALTALVTHLGVDDALLAATVTRLTADEAAATALAARVAALAAAIVTPPPAPAGVTYYRTSFADGTKGPLVTYSYNGTARWAPSTTWHEPDSPTSMACVIPATGTSDDAGALQAWFGHGGLTGAPLDPTLDQDLFEQVRFVIGPGSLAAVPSGGQLKVHKATYGQVGSNTNGWVMSEYAPSEAAGRLFSEPELWGLNGTPLPWPGAALEGHVYDVVYRYHRYSALGVGTIAIWVDGVKVVDSPRWPYMGDARGSAQGLCLQSGAVYAQKTSAPVTVYVLFTQATSFPIGAGVASP